MISKWQSSTIKEIDHFGDEHADLSLSYKAPSPGEEPATVFTDVQEPSDESSQSN
jgi:hypothetical protein